MQRIILMLLSISLISGCAGQGKYSSSGKFDASRAELKECDDTGGTHVNLIYDNHQVRTVASADLKPGKIFSIRLMPKNDREIDRFGVDYLTETVTISGKDDASGWLSAEGTFAKAPEPHHDLVICVPPDLADGNYYYKIKITETGSLDPRVKVKQ